MKKTEEKLPKKGDKVKMHNGQEWEEGTVLDNDFTRVKWDNGDIERWDGMWGTFVANGGFLKNE